MGLVIGAFSGISIIFTLRNLRKHGRLYLADQKRWSVVGRRWQWYWVLFITAYLTISAINGVDVDRDYLQSTPIILQSFFYYLMLPGILACVWESVRHWLVFLGEEFALLTSSGVRGRSVRYATWTRSLCLRTTSGAGRNSISLSASICSMGFCSS